MLYLISYNLGASKTDHQRIISKLEELGAKRVLVSEWLLRSDEPPDSVGTSLSESLDNDDSYLITEIEGRMTWSNLRISDRSVRELLGQRSAIADQW